ncbi:MAG: carboxylesterase family protein [Planctomycetota bacterium]
MRVALICSGLVLFCWAGCVSQHEKRMESQPALTPGQHGQAFEKTITKTISCQYLLFLPAGYGENERQWPLILFLHGMGQCGSDLEKVKEHGIPKIVEGRKDFAFIAVSPQCPEGEFWSSDVLINLLDEVTSRHAVDPSRIYLTGLSLGGGATWHIACEHPDRFAAIAPICGWGSPAKACNLKDVPVWAFHGAKDKVIPVKGSKEMVQVLKDCGGDARLTVYPETGHDSWTQTYDNQELYDWFLSHRRDKKVK